MRKQLAKIAFTACLALAAAFTFNCSGDDSGGGGSRGSFTDTRDSKTYPYVVIGGKTWMAENLKFAADGSKCGDESTGQLSDVNTASCDTYGRLYNWETARTACPPGWHLPSNAEWTALTNAVGSNAGTKLKATNGWNSNGNGTDTYGFSALPGGDGGGDDFGGVGIYGNWWSSTEIDASQVYYRSMHYYYANVDEHLVGKTNLLSVRCVKD